MGRPRIGREAPRETPEGQGGKEAYGGTRACLPGTYPARNDTGKQKAVNLNDKKGVMWVLRQKTSL